MNHEHEIPGILIRLAALERQVAELVGAGTAHAAPAESKPESKPAVEPIKPQLKPPVMPPPLPKTISPAIPSTPVTEHQLAEPLAQTVSVSPEPILADKAQPQPETQQAGSREIKWGAWMAIRAGAVLLVIGIVFLGIKFSLSQPPWVRFVEILIAALGLSGLGLRLERRYAAYGAVIFGAGLSVLYFAMMGGYSVPAMQVFQGPGLSLLLQFAVVGAIIALALRRTSPVLATMATLLGFVACFFSLGTGQSEFALPAAWLLGAACIAFFQLRRWAIPLALGMPASYLIFFSIVLTQWHGAPDAPSFGMALLFPLGNFLLYLAADVARLTRGIVHEIPQRRMFQSVSSGAAIASGYLVTLLLHPDLLASYYLLFGAIWLGLAALYYTIARKDLLVPVFLIKASALISMWVVVSFVGQARWLALGVQAIVLLAGARHSRMRTAFILSTLAWIVSLGFFWIDAGKLGLFTNPMPLHSAHGLLSLLYLFASTALFTLHGRWAQELSAETQRADSTRMPALNGLHVTLLMLLSLLVLSSHGLGDYGPIETIGIALGMVAIGLGLRHWSGAVAALAPLALAHAQVWLWSTAQRGEPLFLINGFVIVAISLTMTWGVRRRIEQRAPAGHWLGYESTQSALYLAWLPTLLVIYAKWLPPMQAGAAGAATAIAMVLLAPRYPRQYLIEISIMPICALLFAAMLRFLRLDGFAPVGSTSAAAGLMFVLAFTHACLAICWAPRHPQIAPMNAMQQNCVTALTALAGLCALSFIFNGMSFVLGVAIIGVAITGLARWPGLRPALGAGAFYLLIAHAAFYARALYAGMHFDTRAMLLALGAAAMTVGYAVLARRFWRPLSGGLNRVIQWIGAGLALLMAYCALAAGPETVEAWTSVCWGASALALFAVGFLDRARPLRIVALIGFALCIARAFIFDIDSATDRIYAFIVLGAALMGIGFVYVRFRDRLEAWDREANEHQPPRTTNQ